jgi:CheY-like chemotaxis protein
MCSASRRAEEQNWIAIAGARRPARTVPAVVYIEDDPVSSMLVQHILDLRGNCTLHVAVDGKSGLILCRRLRPDIVLLDMHLPDMSGCDVLQELRADRSTRPIPCIALSADARPDSIKRARESGFDDYWTKPIDVWEVLRQLDELLEGEKFRAA